MKSIKFLLVLAIVLSCCTFVQAVALGSDGYADRVIVRDNGSGGAVWYVDQSGQGGFGDGQAELVGGFGNMSDKHMIGDVNGDGYADRVVARLHESGDYWNYFASFSNSTGFGSGVADLVGSFGGPGTVPYAVADLNGDGFADRIGVSISAQNNRNYWGSQTGDGGTFPGGATWTSFWGGTNTSLVGAFDVNNDGIADRVDAFGNNWRVDFGPEAGGFGDSANDWTGYFGGTGDNITRLIGDLSDDGYGDRVLATLNAQGYHDWVASLSTATGFGTSGVDYTQQASFGQEGDILILHDVIVPEPATLSLMAIGGIFAALRRRKV
jgi:hypothetical protein